MNKLKKFLKLMIFKILNLYKIKEKNMKKLYKIILKI